MQTPNMRWNPDTKQVEEATGWAPAADRAQIETDLNEANGLLKAANDAVDGINKQLQDLEQSLAKALEAQEVAREKVVFQGARITAFDQAIHLRGEVLVDGEASPAPEVLAGTATIEPEPDPVAASDESEAAAAESDATQEADEQLIPIRHKVSV